MSDYQPTDAELLQAVQEFLIGCDPKPTLTEDELKNHPLLCGWYEKGRQIALAMITHRTAIPSKASMKMKAAEPQDSDIPFE